MAIMMLALGLPAALASGEVPRQGEFQDLTKWRTYAYEISSSYPFVTALPTADRIPAIIDAMGTQLDVAESQLACLTRVSFSGSGGTRLTVVEKARLYRAWWESTGKEHARRVDTEGRRDPEAWKLLVGDADIPCPAYKILLPAEWNFTLSFRTGDYGAVQREIITMQRTKDAASLRRHYSTDSTAPFQYEIWRGFTPQEADRFLCGLAYAIDQPWFVQRFICPPSKDPAAGLIPRTSHPGRRWNTYYSSADWSGVRLPDGRVWWNDDPWVWHSTAKREFPELSLDAGCRLVYPFLCHQYPEKQAVGGGAGWARDPHPPPEAERPKNDWAK